MGLELEQGTPVVPVWAVLVAQGLAQEQELVSVKLAVPAAPVVATVAAVTILAADQAAVLLVLAAELVQAVEAVVVLVLAQAQGLGLGLGQVVTEAKATAVVKAAAAVRLMAVAKAAAVAAAKVATGMARLA